MNYFKLLLVLLFLCLLQVSPVSSQEAGGTLFYLNSKKRVDGGFGIMADYKLHDKVYPTFIFNHYMKGIRNREYGIGCKYLFKPSSDIIIGGIYNYDRETYQVIIQLNHAF